MFEDKRNLLYLTYIQSVLGEVQTTLKVFEGENIDPTKLLDSLTLLLRSICKRVVYQPANFNVLTTPIQESHINPFTTLGYAFETCVRTINMTEDNVRAIKKRCIDFTVKLINELQNRLPPNIEILTKMNKLSTTEVLRTKTNDSDIIDLAQELGFKNVSVIEKITQQWNNINFIKWRNIENTTDFWVEVQSYKDAGNENPFRELCSLAFTVLSLPHSNAEIERVFSAMNLIKSKLRNRMGLATLNSILMIRSTLKRMNKTCFSYELPSDVLRLIGTNKAYSYKDVQQDPQPSTSGLIRVSNPIPLIDDSEVETDED